MKNKAIEADKYVYSATLIAGIWQEVNGKDRISDDVRRIST